MNLYLIRHARQASKLCNVNVELSKEGEQQAQLLAKRLAKYPIDALYSSDLTRAVQTAEFVNQYHHLEHHIREEIQEIDFGELTGNTDADNAANYGEFQERFQQMEQDLAYPGGESGADVYERAIKVLEEIVETDAKEVAIVTHGGTIRALLAGILGVDQAKRPMFAPVLENTGITQLSYNKERKQFYLQRFNDCAHLEGHPELMRGSWK